MYENSPRFHQIASNKRSKSKFPGGACPQTPLVCKGTVICHQVHVVLVTVFAYTQSISCFYSGFLSAFCSRGGKMRFYESLRGGKYVSVCKTCGGCSAVPCAMRYMGYSYVPTLALLICLNSVDRLTR